MQKDRLWQFFEENIIVSCNSLAFGWYPKPNYSFYHPNSKLEAKQLCMWLLQLDDGCCLPIRGRDWSGPYDFTEWDEGVAIKNKSQLFFLYESGCVERFDINDLNFEDLVHFCCTDDTVEQSEDNSEIEDPCKVMILSHGWSEEVGPDYPLIRTLEFTARKQGWKVIVPDFRPTYRYSSQRGRAERVKMIYEELLCLQPRPHTVVLAGHSQGGAASSLACTQRVQKSCNIKGLILFGSEDPRDLDAMDWKPIFDPGCGVIVHADGDMVVSASALETTAKKWNFEFKLLHSTVRRGERDCWGDDINHDFTAKDLINPSLLILKDFLSQFK